MLYNFSAGPAALPEKVRQVLQEELFNYQGSQMSIIEMSHRGHQFVEILEETESLLREMLLINDNYEIVFMQGGASSQFAILPMNLINKGKAAYIDSGVWASKAIAEAKRILEVDVIASSEKNGYKTIPHWNFIQEESEYDYLHITSNNTIYGTQFHDFIKPKSTPLVADMSSDILSRIFDVNSFGLIYAGGQKNLGVAGMAVVIIRKDLLESIQSSIPNIFNYRVFVENKNLYHTPNVFAIYVCNLMLRWMKSKGGMEEFDPLNRRKASMLYKSLDESNIFSTYVKGIDRSNMNIPFSSGDLSIDQDFLNFAEQNNLFQLAGHRSLGGIRASIYNSMPLSGVEKLIDVIQEFEYQNKHLIKTNRG